ncbi:MAG: hypothetical protein RMI74_05895 [Thermodesulfobacterium sp.]|nr:hypothetical protein [Thermodesulfobacterium sp.]
MKRLIFLLLLMTFLITSNSLGSNLDLGVSINNGRITNFYVSLGEYYRVPYDEIVIIKKRYPIIRDEELPLFFLIISYARVSPDVIIELRRGGLPWYEIMIRFGLEPERIFHRYIIVYGPPYGRAYGHYKKPPKKIILKDYHIIELSQIKFFSEYYNQDPKIVIDLKKKEKNYMVINEKLYHSKGKRDKDLKDKDFKDRDRDFKDRDKDFKDRDGRDFKDKNKDFRR